MLTLYSFFRSRDSMYLYIVTEKSRWLLNLNRMVFSLTFTFWILLCLRWTPSQEKHIFLGGMNHCWLNHLLSGRKLGLVVQAVMCESVVLVPFPFGSKGAGYISCPMEMTPHPLYTPQENCQQWWILVREGWEWDDGEKKNKTKHQTSFKATHSAFPSSPGSAWTSGVSW